ncbi:Panacea domain-containing protein [Anaerolactibacter massiliensis]|uniref:Panacea domain-containing protein n=1 Tax=Anaerolactibacter massiliensis TaxID=2044573 RepID=UPI00195BFA30|nr:type II toxin-antitoxin system antitoxin SocA domain-containing protein [Anaerolactibacter massiliensis]
MTLVKNTLMPVSKSQAPGKTSFSADRYASKQILNFSAESISRCGYCAASDSFNDAISSLTPSSVATPVIFQVAHWFLNKAPMSDKKLQKLCYYAYAWYIVFFNDAEAINNEKDIKVLCDDYFEAWIHGPVCRRLYNKYRQYGWENIPSEVKAPAFNEDVTDLLNQVWDIYGSLSADQLEHLTHQEDPWNQARKGVRFGDACTNKISPLAIFNYYSKLQNE